MVFVSSAGNYSGPYSVSPPGTASKSISVANAAVGSARYEYNLDTGTWTVRGSEGPVGQSHEIKPDISAHGAHVLSARPPWVVDENAAPNYGFASGTSMSAPHIAGAAALLVEYSRRNGGQWTSGEIKTRLMNTAFPFGSNHNPFNAGAGYADIYAAAHTDTVVSVAYDRAATRPGWPPVNPTVAQTGSFSFGNVGAAGEENTFSLLSEPSPNVRALEASIQNNSGSTRTYTIEGHFSNNPGNAAALTLSQRSVTAGPGETAVFTAAMSVGGHVAAGFYTGHIFVKEGGTVAARLPFALVSENQVRTMAGELRFNLGGTADSPVTPLQNTPSVGMSPRLTMTVRIIIRLWTDGFII
jgi:minor extracellular serine protease Vpr